MTYNPTAAWDRSELARLRAENADLTQELATVRDTLRHRSNALNATGTHNDQLRAQLERIKRLCDSADDGGKHVSGRAFVPVAFILAALADKEPTP